MILKFGFTPNVDYTVLSLYFYCDGLYSIYTIFMYAEDSVGAQTLSV
jgi:hypothetical protein